MADDGAIHPVAPSIDDKLDALDDHLQPIEEAQEGEKSKDESKQDSKEDTKAEESAKSEKSESDQDDGKTQDAGGDEGKTDESGDEGYTIDEGEEEDGDEEPASNSTQEPPKANQLTPEQQYIVDNLTPLKIQGYVGDSEKLQQFDVLTPEQLPQGFRFADDRDRTLAAKGFNMLEQKATQLQSDYRNQENQKATKAFEEAENASDRADIGKLQREGDLPKFKTDVNDKAFDQDPAAKLIQEVLDFKDERNKQYLEESQRGRPYKHIGFEEAFYMYRRSNPAEFRSEEQKQEDTQRKEIARRTSRSTGASPDDSKKPRVHAGSSTRDLYNLIDNLDW